MPVNYGLNMQKGFSIHGQVHLVGNKLICMYKGHGGCTALKEFNN